MDQEQKHALNKAKYERILKSDGLSAALTAIHHDMWSVEYECFESPKGYNPALYDILKDYRKFSRELWDQNQVYLK